MTSTAKATQVRSRKPRTETQKPPADPTPTWRSRAGALISRARAKLSAARKALVERWRKARPEQGWSRAILRPRSAALTEGIRNTLQFFAAGLCATLAWLFFVIGSPVYATLFGVAAVAIVYLQVQYLYVMGTEVLPALQLAERLGAQGSADARIEIPAGVTA